MTLPVPRADFVVIVIVSRLDEQPRVKDVLELRDVNILIPISIQGKEMRHEKRMGHGHQDISYFRSY
jgi:hypothetical protein